MRTTYCSDGFGFLTNQYAAEEMRGHAPDELWVEAAARARKVRNWYHRRRGMGIEDVQRVLADPEEGVCACAGEGSEAEDPAVTLWSWTATLGSPVMYLAKGTPNETPYEPASL